MGFLLEDVAEVYIILHVVSYTFIELLYVDVFTVIGQFLFLLK